MDVALPNRTAPVFLARPHDGDRAIRIWMLERFFQGGSGINARPWKAGLPRLKNYASSPPRGSETSSMCRDSTGEPSGDHSGDFQVVLFQHDHVRVAMKALVAEAECGDLYPRLRQIFGGTVVVNRMIGSLGRDDGGRDIDKISKGPRRRLLLPAANQIRSIRVCLLFDL